MQLLDDPRITAISDRSTLRDLTRKHLAEHVLIIASGGDYYVCATVAGRRIDVAQLGTIPGAQAAAEDLWGPLDWQPVEHGGYVLWSAHGPAHQA